MLVLVFLGLPHGRTDKFAEKVHVKQGKFAAT